MTEVVVSGPIQRELPGGALQVLTVEDIRGLPGSDASVGGYLHEQMAASTTWVVNHMMGRFPAFVVVIDSSGTSVHGGVSNPNENQTVLNFSAPFSGKARLL